MSFYNTTKAMLLILASSSLARKKILTKLGVDFKVIAPDIDENIPNTEAPDKAVYRLAQQKAYAVSKKTEGLIIASDQIAVLKNTILTKPHNHENAILQLQQCSANKVVFLTSLALLNTKTNNIQTVVEKTTVYFRTLTNKQIENYLLKEKPYQCVAGFKSEGLGIVLFTKLIANDPNSLVGLPVIALVDMLAVEGINIV